MGHLAVGSNNINVYACVTLSSTTLLTLLTFSMKVKGGKIFSYFYLALI